MQSISYIANPHPFLERFVGGQMIGDNEHASGNCVNESVRTLASVPVVISGGDNTDI